MNGLLDLARGLTKSGPVLIGIDVALGVSAGYWRLVQEAYRGHPPNTFVHWLEGIDQKGEYFGTAVIPDEWSVLKPWFHVMKGPGGLNAFTRKVSDGMRRKVDVATRAKPIFAVSGIPGTVGSGTREFWKELISLLSGSREFAIWPFEGELESLLDTKRVVLCETYPALAYAAALADELPTGPMANAKTKQEWRDKACSHLAQAEWVRSNQIDLGNLRPARENDDDFDACFTAAAVLRCLCEGRQLSDPYWTDDRAEGSMLLLGAVDPSRRSKTLAVKNETYSQTQSAEAMIGSTSEMSLTEPKKRVMDRQTYYCPIPGCTKEFVGSRGGWDAHVASLRRHPEWRSEITEPEQRRGAFRQEFRDWFE
ncbi:MAG: DUF429 domain-containing protein [Candidatus Tectomicrobia bacterium]|nr:DUF429 domain-containing protein [Candidatus Tectomicrobia bacterium]